MQNPFQTILRFQNFFKFFFEQSIFFTVSTSYTAQVRKVKSAKNNFLVLFYSAKSVSDHFTISEIFQVFFRTVNFHCFKPYTAKVRKVKSEKNHSLVIFYIAKSNSDHFTISKLFQVFFRTVIFFFTVLTFYTAQVRKVKSAKNNFLVLFNSAKSVSDHFTISKFFQVFFRTINFFHCFDLLYCTGEKSEVSKKQLFSALL